MWISTTMGIWQYDEIFKKEVSEYFDIPVLIDYQIFLEVLKPIDNCGKNMYWGIYD